LPPLPETGASARIETWSWQDLGEQWIPPNCLGWTKRKFAVLIAVAGRFDSETDGAAVLTRIAAVSRALEIQYWSISRKSWRPLFSEVYALEEPHANSRRPDFEPEALTPGRDYFLWQKENNPASGVVWRMRFAEISPQRIVFEQTNVSPSRVLFITVLERGEHESFFALSREQGGPWSFYNLTRFGTPERPTDHRQVRSLINRLIAIYRHLAGIATDREPPASP
jgi:hypothetical protein